MQVAPDVPICRRDLPLDRYQPEFVPYAEEYARRALDRMIEITEERDGAGATGAA